jgi:hypothetical protein
MKLIDRNEVMRQLRQSGKLSDEEIGKIFGITRERVAQVLGRKKEDLRAILRRRKAERAARLYLAKGWTACAIEAETGIPQKEIRNAAHRIGLRFSDFTEARRRHKIQIVLKQVQAYLKEHGGPLLTTNLMRYNRPLYNRMWVLAPISEWRQMLNQESRP